MNTLLKTTTDNSISPEQLYNAQYSNAFKKVSKQADNNLRSVKLTLEYLKQNKDKITLPFPELTKDDNIEIYDRAICKVLNTLKSKQIIPKTK